MTNTLPYFSVIIVGAGSTDVASFLLLNSQGSRLTHSTPNHRAVTVAYCGPNSHVPSQPPSRVDNMPMPSVVSQPGLPHDAGRSFAPQASAPSSKPITSQMSESSSMVYSIPNRQTLTCSTSLRIRLSDRPSPSNWPRLRLNLTSTCWKMPKSAKSCG